MVKKTMAVVATAALLYAARRYFRDWGTTKDESRGALPGDGLIAQPVLQATEGVWINAAAEQVWPWLIQMGQDRGGLYVFETVENALGLRSHSATSVADRIHPEWQRLEVGDAVRLVPKGWFGLSEGVEMKAIEVVEPQSIVLRGERPGVPWDMVWTFHLIPHWEDRCRLLIRSRLALRHPGQVVLAELVGPARAFLTRGILIGIKRRAERGRQDRQSDALIGDR